MLEGDSVPGMRSQFGCQALIASVLRFAVEGIKLIVGVLPAFTEKREPLAGRTEEMLIIVQPNGRGFKSEASDAVFGYVHLPAVTFDGHVGHFLKSRLAGGEQLEGSSFCLYECAHHQR